MIGKKNWSPVRRSLGEVGNHTDNALGKT